MLTATVPEGTALTDSTDAASFFRATRRQSATRTRMARRTVQARTWAALRGQG